MKNLVIILITIFFSSIQLSFGNVCNFGKDYLCMKIASTVQPIGRGVDDGFFSLTSFNDKLIAGVFGYKDRNMVYTHYDQSWGVATGPNILLVDESVCAFQEFKDKLYANTESDGLIFVSGDGESWKKVFEGPSRLGCGLTVRGDYLYATNSDNVRPPGLIYRTSDGTDWKEQVYNSGATDLYIRDIISAKDGLYAFAVNVENGEAGYLYSVIGAKGSWRWIKTKFRGFRSYIDEKDNLWLTTSRDYSVNGISSIYKQVDGEFILKHVEPSMSHMSSITSYQGVLFASTTVAWKGSEGQATLIMSKDNGESWHLVTSFDETETWDLHVYKQRLYVATKQSGGVGAVYSLDLKSIDQEIMARMQGILLLLR